MQNRKTKAATRKDVAALAGVAPSTVSLVLNNNPGLRLAQKTRDKVFAAARELQYEPSRLARALVKGRSMNIAVVMHGARAPFSSYVSNIFDGVWEVLEPAGYSLLLSSVKKDRTLGGLFRERSIDAIIVMASPVTVDDPELAAALESDFPMVFVGSRPVGYDVNYVDIDNCKAGMWATQRLIKEGHRKILHLAGPLEHNSSADDRLQGYVKALEKASIAFDPELVVNCSYNYEYAFKAINILLKSKVEFSGIFAANYNSALGAEQALEQSGLKIPGDISITSIDRFCSSQPGLVEIDRLETPLQQIGKKASEILLAKLENPSIGNKHVLLPFKEFSGASVAAPRQ